MQLTLDNHILVIFGASGDLTARKLIPAYFKLFQIGLLPQDFAFLGVSRTQYSDQEFGLHLMKFLKQEYPKASDQEFENFLKHIYYIAINTSDPADYKLLYDRLIEINELHDCKFNCTYYLSTPPSLYGIIAENLASVDLNIEPRGWTKLVVEKPFGYDLESAKELDKKLHKYFYEKQIYRIDHYLGKETVQNILVTRFSNIIFESLWNHNYIQYVEITNAEDLGLEGRGGYYDNAGAMRDMLQNHILQVLAMVAMEPPVVINADSMRNEVVKVFQSLRRLELNNITESLVLGQYDEGEIHGEEVPSYINEKGVKSGSKTETYVALKVFIDNWRWKNVPFFIRTGKRLAARVTEIKIHFKKTPHPIFAKTAPDNTITIRIQPDESINLGFGLKSPGSGFNSTQVTMDFEYSSLSNDHILTAYERLLLDIARGDATLFARTDAVEECWNFVQPILDYKNSDFALAKYPSGSWGPKAADRLINSAGYSWSEPTIKRKK